jgi:hypothetical protein
MNPRRGQPRGSAHLARRLRELREQRWPGRVVTQKALAEALGGGKPLSVSSISSYENEDTPSVPPEPRLRAYATFFATERSLTGGAARVLPDDELTDAERSARDQLYGELLSLRAAAPAARVAPAGPLPTDLWTFPPGEPVRLICGRLENMTHPYAEPSDPNYTELLSYADVGALVELFGHIRMRNPTCDVRFLLADSLTADDLSSHLVLVGGIGLNDATRWILGLTDLPIRQVEHPDVANGEVFEVNDGGTERTFLPTMTQGLGLVQDVGLLARLSSPTNVTRTLTVCNGIYSRGVLGAVRSLTDAELRDQNKAYLSSRFPDRSRFCVLMNVPVLGRQTVTPDLQREENRLYEWPGVEAGNFEKSAEAGSRTAGIDLRLSVPVVEASG